MDILYTYFIYFIIYGIIGWLMEVTVKLFELKRFVNRGFLIGPICPIYGCGVVTCLLLIGKPSNIALTFIKSIIVCSILEYATSFIMEKLFNARWWDYSKNKFNINGRICANTMIPFGILGCLVVYVVHPFIKSFVESISFKYLQIIAISLFVIFIIDNVLSYIVVGKIKSKINKNELDNTEAIKEEITEWFMDNSILYRRIIYAYPSFMIAVKDIKQNIHKSAKSVKKGIEETTTSLVKEIDDRTDAIVSGIQKGTTTISSDIRNTRNRILIRLNYLKKVKK